MGGYMKHDFLIKLDDYKEYAPIVLRFVMGLVFVVAGYAKLTGIQGVIGFFSGLGIPLAGFFAWFVALVEFFGGIALLIGIATRYASALLGIIMFVAMLTTKFPEGTFDFKGARVDLMLLAASITLMFIGGGKLSLDKKFCEK